ncbi:AAA family ATPase [Solidesulfovibrio carbinolicus]|nr:ATP-binding protein [Solidesulfovibrio carbinolicus]
MSERYIKGVTLVMIRNLLKRFGPTTELAGDLVNWLEDKGWQLGVHFDRGREMKRRWRHSDKLSKGDWKSLRDKFATAELPRSPSTLRKNLESLGHTFHLDNLEIDILELGVLYRLSNLVESLLDVGFECADFVHVIAAVLLKTRDEVHRRLSPGSKLRSSGLLCDDMPYAREFAIKTSHKTMAAVCPPRKLEKEMRRIFLGPPCTPNLLWQDFDHIGRERDLALRILQGALNSAERGVNLLVYGPPGTGKTEFCKVLAHKAGVALHVVGEADEDGEEMERRERISALRMSQTLLAEKDDAVLLAEEMEDFFWGGESRVYAHRILEDNSRPVLWTCNHIESFEPSILRRLTMALEIRTPDVAVRGRVWRRILAREGIKLPQEDVSALASEFQAPPSMAVSAVRGAKLAGGGGEEIRQLVRGLAKIVPGNEERLIEVAPDPFDATLAAADQDLEVLVKRLAASQSRAFSLCLSGPPGTGKSAFARHLAKCLGLEVRQQRTSDLLSMWVGGSEKQIAKAFAEARESGVMLVFDEADSLLRDRRSAQQSWEITQVNEMLTWMERHPLPFACTTNLMEHLDQASLRRFTFKVHFNYLGKVQAERTFAAFFGYEAIGGVSSLAMLTPGDFAVVRRKAEILGLLGDVPALVRMLREESRVKGLRSNRIGFIGPCGGGA